MFLFLLRIPLWLIQSNIFRNILLHLQKFGSFLVLSLMLIYSIIPLQTMKLLCYWYVLRNLLRLAISTAPTPAPIPPATSCCQGFSLCLWFLAVSLWCIWFGFLFIYSIMDQSFLPWLNGFHQYSASISSNISSSIILFVLLGFN